MDLTGDALLTSVNRTDLHFIKLYQPYYIREVGNVLKKESVKDLKVFLRYKVLQFAAPYSSQSFENENFRFNNRVLSGQKEMEPRWKRVINTMDSVMGGVIGKIYVQKYFTPQEKAQVSNISDNIKNSLRTRITNASWMDPETRKNATPETRYDEN